MNKKSKPSISSSSALEDFYKQNLLANPREEVCKFFQQDLDFLKENQCFPESAVFFKPDPSLRSDFASKSWVCFLLYPFLLGLKYPFPPLIEEFFRVTKLSYSQAMPMVWRVLYTLEILNRSEISPLGLPEIAFCYNLRSHGSSRFLFQRKSNRESLILKTTKNDIGWKEKFFFVRRDSIPGGEDIPIQWVNKGRISIA